MNMQATTGNLEQLDQSHYLHPFTDFEGTTQRTAAGFFPAPSIFISMTAMATRCWTVCLGSGAATWVIARPAIVEAVTEQMHKLPYYNSFSSAPMSRQSNWQRHW